MASLALCVFGSVANANVDCTGDGNRMASIQINMAWCIDNGMNGSNLMIQGRFDPSMTAAVKRGYDDCQEGRPGSDHSRICDEATFWVAAHSVIKSRSQRIGVNAALTGWQGPLTLFPGPNEISVTGTWKSDRGRPAHGPEGSGSMSGNGLPQGGLLWNITPNASPQYFPTFPVVLSGPNNVYFSINDDYLADNSGYVEVIATQK